jgi:hypothetical protein
LEGSTLTDQDQQLARAVLAVIRAAKCTPETFKDEVLALACLVAQQPAQRPEEVMP